MFCDELIADFGNGLEAREARSAIAARLVHLWEIDRMAFWEFCNNIGTYRASGVSPNVAWGQE